MSDESDAKQILTASRLENRRRPPGHPHTTWMKTTQQDLESLNLSLNGSGPFRLIPIRLIPFRLIPIRLITLYWRKYSNPDPNPIPNPNIWGLGELGLGKMGGHPLNEAFDVTQNHPLWRMMSTFGAMHS